MKYYIIAGETSGDQHAAMVLKELKHLDSNGIYRGIGGDECVDAGLDLLIHQKELSFMGIWEVIRNISTISKALKEVKSDILHFRPDVILLVDYPGFNLKIAEFAKRHGILVHYYIAPKVWAWKESRIKKLKAYVDQLYCILPFEESYFRSKDVNCVYVGNPSLEKIKQFNKNEHHVKDQIALLPGSRAQEIKKNMRIMLQLKTLFPEYVFKIAQAPNFSKEYYRQWDQSIEVTPDMYTLLSESKAAVVTSGTATLETAFLQVPQVVCYKTSAFTFLMAKLLVKIKWISLVNIIMNKEVVKELIQSDFNQKELQKELQRLLNSDVEILRDYSLLLDKMGDKRPSVEVAALLQRKDK